MERSIKNPREQRFSYRENEDVKFPDDDKIIVYDNVIDDDGSIKKIKREEIMNVGELLHKTPAYVDKIEYIQKYGTLNNDGIIRYDFSRTSDMEMKQVGKYVNDIINKYAE